MVTGTGTTGTGTSGNSTATTSNTGNATSTTATSNTGADGTGDLTLTTYTVNRTLAAGTKDVTQASLWSTTAISQTKPHSFNSIFNSEQPLT